MGAWSHEPFGNDTANDWAYDLEETQDFMLLEAAFDAVLEAGDDYVESDLGSEAVAAAEVLAKVLGQGTQSDAYTEKLDEWVRSISCLPGPQLLAKGRTVLQRVLGPNSELCELWEEGDEAELWRKNVESLIAALHA